MFAFSTLVSGLDPNAYMAELARMALVDGLDPGEKAFLRQQAMLLGLDITRISTRKPDWTQEKLANRRLVYRDCFQVCLTDGQVSKLERQALMELRVRLGVEPTTAADLESWVIRYTHLLAEGDAMLLG
jgi:hypothetical protein